MTTYPIIPVWLNQNKRCRQPPIKLTSLNLSMLWVKPCGFGDYKAHYQVSMNSRSVGISRRELGFQKRGAEGSEKICRRHQGEGNGEVVPLSSLLGSLWEHRKLPQQGAPAENGFAAFWAIKTHVLTRKFTIFYIFLRSEGINLAPMTNKRKQLGGGGWRH